MSDSYLNIPGYYYDTISRRYYRQDPANPRPQIFNVLPESVIKPKSVINLLNKRETGTCKFSFENQVISSKATNLYCAQTKFCVNTFERCEEVEFLKGGEKTLYVEYSNKQRTKHFLDEKLHFFSPNKDTYKCFYGCYPDSYSTVDMVESPNGGNFLVLVVSNSNCWKVLLTPRNHQNERVSHKVHCNKKPIWCCAKNDFTSKVAFGENNNLYVSTIQVDGYSDGYKLPVRGEVRSVDFNKQGNLLFTGRHTGHIGNIDLRARHSVFYDKLYKIGIDETILLSDENFLICGAFDGMICKVDLRMRKPVCEYYGHVTTPRKCSFSLCEYNHLLCASGSDNITRLWNLSGGGEPLRRFKPPKGDAPRRAWLTSDGFKFKIYHFQNGQMYVYNE